MFKSQLFVQDSEVRIFGSDLYGVKRQCQGLPKVLNTLNTVYLAYAKVVITLGNVDYCNTHSPIIRTLLSQRRLYLSDLLKKFWNRDTKLYKFRYNSFLFGLYLIT